MILHSDTDGVAAATFFAVAAGAGSEFVSERKRHSEKPLIHKEIERLVDGPYIELFARKKPYENWDYWGNEV